MARMKKNGEEERKEEEKAEGWRGAMRGKMGEICTTLNSKIELQKKSKQKKQKLTNRWRPIVW